MVYFYLYIQTNHHQCIPPHLVLVVKQNQLYYSKFYLYTYINRYILYIQLSYKYKYSSTNN